MITDEQFVLMIESLLRVKTVEQLATDLRVSKPTIERWSVGESVPVSAGRDSVYLYFEEELQKCLLKFKAASANNKNVNIGE